MNKFMWILGITTLGLAAYVVFLNDSLERTSRYPVDGENVGDQIGQWGTKQRVKGKGGQIGGKFKQAVGNLTGDDELQGSGVLDEIEGAVKDVAGKAAHAVSEAAHDRDF